MTTQVLVLKTGALGDVLRTTAILPGLAERYDDLRVTWLTAHGARPLVEHHPLVDRVVTVDPKDADSVAAAPVLSPEGGRWHRVLSFDDEEPLCRLASAAESDAVSGDYMTEDGGRAYTDDVAPWFDMGLLSRRGKEEADRLKVANERTHPAIYADMLGIEMGEPELPLPDEAAAFGAAFAERNGLTGEGLRIGLNTGAGGRWESKKLPVERTVELARTIVGRHGARTRFVVLGGPDEAERNAAILAGVGEFAGAVDAGTDNSLLEFAAIVDGLDLLITSDSLALHVANARRVPIVAFFAPTSAAEIELYGRGEKVVSTAPDYCSYKADADNSTITVERLLEAVQRVRREHGAQTR